MTLCLLVAMLAPMVAGAAPMTSNTSTMPKAFSTGAYPPNPMIEGISPTTGLPSSKPYRPVLAQISNAKEARPHWNFSAADIVYEMIYWGPAHTRYIVVYNDQHPNLVGSLRSARVGHASVRQEWDAPYMFWGAQSMTGSSVYDFFKSYDAKSQFLFDANPAGHSGTRTSIGPLFSRDSRRTNPHDAVGNVEQLVASYWPTNDDGTPYTPKNHAFAFSSTNPTLGTDSATEVHIMYDDGGKEYYPSYVYNPSLGLYERFYNGEEQYDGITNERIVASNIIVQFADLSFYNNTKSRPIVNLVGAGVMDLFIGGTHIRGSWARSTMNNRTVFTDLSGQEITLLPGKTFIQIIPNSHEYFYKTSDGTTVTLDFGADVKAAEFDTTESEADIDKME